MAELWEAAAAFRKVALGSAVWGTKLQRERAKAEARVKAAWRAADRLAAGAVRANEMRRFRQQEARVARQWVASGGGDPNLSALAALQQEVAATGVELRAQFAECMTTQVVPKP